MTKPPVPAKPAMRQTVMAPQPSAPQQQPSSGFQTRPFGPQQRSPSPQQRPPVPQQRPPIPTTKSSVKPPAPAKPAMRQYKIESAIVSVNACNGIGTNSDPHPHKGAVLDETKW